MTAHKNIDRAKLVQMYEQHQNVSYVAELLGIAFNTAKYHLKQAGVHIGAGRPRPRAVLHAMRNGPFAGLMRK